MTSTSGTTRRRHDHRTRKTENGINMGTINIRAAIMPKFEALAELMEKYELHYLAIQEAQLNENSLGGLRSRAKKEGYRMFKGKPKDRKGVAVYDSIVLVKGFATQRDYDTFDTGRISAITIPTTRKPPTYGG